MNRNDSGALRPDEAALARQTSQWLETLKQDDPRQREAFVAWLKESPRNVREYLTMVAFDRALSGIDKDRRHDVQALLAEARRNVIPLGDAPSRDADLRAATNKPGGRGRWIVPAALAASLAAAMAVYQMVPGGWQDLSTGIGEQRTVELDDGSIVQLNTRSRLEVRLTGNARELRLREGEAIFRVRPDPSRPFRVHTDTAVIQAVGTQFNVYRGGGETKVSVLEGVVRVSGKHSAAGQRLVAGEQMRVAPAGLVKAARPDVEKAVAWRERRLVFDDAALADMAAEFNRYNRKPQVRLEGGVGDRRYTGTFDADDPESLALLLEEEHDLQVTVGAETILVRPGKPPN